MTFARIRTFGSWLDGGTLEETELETFDLNLSRAIDGHAGGTYAPSSELVIGGAGTRFTSDVHFEAIAYFDGSSVQVGHTLLTLNLECLDTAQFDDDISVAGIAHFNGTSVQVGHILLTNTLEVLSTSEFHGAVTLDDALGVTGVAQFAAGFISYATSGFAGDVTLAGVLDLGTTGSVKWRETVAPNSNFTVGANDTDAVWYDAATLTADRSITVSNTGAQDGMFLKVSRIADTTSNVVFVKDASATILAELKKLSSGDPRSCTLIRRNGAWKLYELGSLTP